MTYYLVYCLLVKWFCSVLFHVSFHLARRFIVDEILHHTAFARSFRDLNKQFSCLFHLFIKVSDCYIYFSVSFQPLMFAFQHTPCLIRCIRDGLGRCSPLPFRYPILLCHIQNGSKKTGPFLNVDNFALVSGRKACYMSKVCKFCLEKKYKTCIAVCLNILCLICINIHYP